MGRPGCNNRRSNSCPNPARCGGKSTRQLSAVSFRIMKVQFQQGIGVFTTPHNYGYLPLEQRHQHIMKVESERYGHL